MEDGKYYDLVMGLKKSLSVVVQTAGVGAGVFGVLDGLPDAWADVPAIGVGGGLAVLLGIVKFCGNFRKQTGRFPWQR